MLGITECFNILWLSMGGFCFNGKVFARSSQVLVVTKLAISGKQCKCACSRMILAIKGRLHVTFLARFSHHLKTG